MKTKPHTPDPEKVAAAEREAVRGDGKAYDYDAARTAARDARDRLKDILAGRKSK